jgi:succinoglycan biosynthesis transport protein ExoP
MNHSRHAQPSGGIDLGDIYYVLFRHKWKIILLSVAGFMAAAAYYILKPPPYQSQAELLIQYVSQARSLPLTGSDSRVIVPDSGGAGVISAEIQILTSLDVAEEAATNIGPAKILAKAGGGDDPIGAAAVIQGNLTAVPADRDSGVIWVSFKHPDPKVVQPVLQQVIDDYFQKHHEIHSAVGEYDGALSREGATLKAQLNDTEQQLANLQSKAKVISLDNSRSSLADQISRIQDSILNAQADLAGYEAVMKQANIASPDKPEATNAPPVIIPADQIEAYNEACARLDTLRKRKQDYLLQGYTSANVLVQEVNGLIVETTKAITNLEGNYPEIGGMTSVLPTVDGQPAAPSLDLRAQKDQITSIKAKLKVWGQQLNQLQMEATNLNTLALNISQLEQTRVIQQQNYQNLATKLENSHIDEALDTGKTPNIKWIQTPTPPYQDWKKVRKKAGMLAFGGIFAGIAWAFLIELYLDRTIRRPKEILSKLNLPLFLSIPDVSANGHARLAKPPKRPQLQLNNKAAGEKVPSGDGEPSPAMDGALQVVSLERNPTLKPYYEALRDRLIVYFEVRNLKHKPKMVAVTSAGKGAGVSTMAAGLAASLSETGDGNVLLVDMNLEHGAAQQFYRGKACCGLDIALEKETKQEAMVRENLYVVTGESKNYEMSRILPKRFAALVPKFEASEFDYIIFDMPPVSQTSITSRLARFMDMIMLVVESEKTDREIVQQVNTWLGESGANIGAVLNKTRKYVPEKLHQDFNSGV